jgi:hypothetical protein
MPGEQIIDFRSATFRANPRYELVPVDLLPPEQKTLLTGSPSMPTPYGLPPSPSREGWRMWRRHDRRRERGTTPGVTYKLYVSPVPAAIEEAFAETVEAVALAGGRNFKVGRDVHGLLRPDKPVAYFDEFEQLCSAAERLRTTLDGCAAHGVPFTAELAGNALLSWGIDPPAHLHSLTWSPESESWRLWITNRLAGALISAKASHPASIEPWRFALKRLRFDGVDTDTWTPDRTVWAEAITPER